MKLSALWLPSGSVRAIIALILVGGITYLAVATQAEGIVAAFVGLATLAVKSYFDKKEPTEGGSNVPKNPQT